MIPRPSLPELDRRIAGTLADLGRSNGEAYTELLGDLAAFRAMRAQVEQAEALEAVNAEHAPNLRRLAEDSKGY